MEATHTEPPRAAALTCLLLHHPLGVRAVPLREGQTLIIGRGVDTDVRLSERSLSRRHARFELGDGALWVDDLGSTNGTRVDGRRVRTRVRVVAGQVVSLGGRVSVLFHAAWACPERSGAMQVVDGLVARAAPSDIGVLVLGETGVGKELVARALHHGSRRRTGPLQAVNCGAIPEALIVSTFFGHERGAFSGAAQASPGVFEAASGGTLFLDEVGELPATGQAALLRVLETQRVTRVGGTHARPVDVRVVAATHHDLQHLCSQGRFRRDLLYRLDGLTIVVPPLRERRQEIAQLARTFLDGRALHTSALACLERYDWPGNVRELRNVIHAAAAVATTPWIMSTDLPARVRRLARDHGRQSPLRARLVAHERALLHWAWGRAGGQPVEAAALLCVPPRTLLRKLRAHAPSPTGECSVVAHPDGAETPAGLARSLAALERRLIESALQCSRSPAEAAVRLGLRLHVLSRRARALAVPLFAEAVTPRSMTLIR